MLHGFDNGQQDNSFLSLKQHVTVRQVIEQYLGKLREYKHAMEL